MFDDARRAVLDAFHVSACSYVKPGAMHRLSLGGLLDQYIMSGHAMLPVVEKAYRRGEEVARGARGMPEAGIGGLILEAARTIYAWLGRPAPSLEAAAGAVVMAASIAHVYSSKRRVSAGSVRSLASRLVQASSPRDFSDFYEALRVAGEHRALDVLGERGLRPSRAQVEGLSLLDAFEALGRDYPGYLVLSPRSRVFGDVAELIRSRYSEKKNLNDAVVYGYVELVKESLPGSLRATLEEAREKGLMSSREGARLLLGLDRELAKRSISFNRYVPVLTTVLAPLIAEGLRP